MKGHTMTDRVATIGAYSGSGAAMVFGISATEFAAYVGAGVAVLTFLVNVWFKAQHLKIARQRCEVANDDQD